MSSSTATSTSNSSPIPSSGVVFGGLSGGKGNLLWGIDIWLDTAQWPVAKRRSPLEMAAGDSG